MQKLRKCAPLCLLFAIILLGLPSCASSPTATDSFCTVADQIGAPLTYSSSKDTPETRAGIDRFNAAFLTICMHEVPM